MLSISLEGPTVFIHELGAAHELSIFNRQLLLDGKETARHVGPTWEVEGLHFPTITIEGAATVTFWRSDGAERPATTCQKVAFHDGALWIKGPIDALLALLSDQTGLWTLRMDNSQWDGVRIVSC
jgi:hypothetical protein